MQFLHSLLQTTGNLAVQYRGPGYGHPHMDWGGSFFFSPMSWIWIVLIVIGIIVIYRVSKGPSQTQTRETPEDILKNRYARGEITREEFHQMKKDLKEKTGGKS